MMFRCLFSISNPLLLFDCFCLPWVFVHSFYFVFPPRRRLGVRHVCTSRRMELGKKRRNGGKGFICE